MERLADLHASGSNFAPHVQIRTENKCVSMHLYAFFVHQICAAGDITYQNWNSFNCSMNVAIVTLVYTVTLSIETQKYRLNTSIFVYVFRVHPFCCIQKLVKTACPPGMEGPCSIWTRADFKPEAA